MHLTYVVRYIIYYVISNPCPVNLRNIVVFLENPWAAFVDEPHNFEFSLFVANKLHPINALNKLLATELVDVISSAMHLPKQLHYIRHELSLKKQQEKVINTYSCLHLFIDFFQLYQLFSFVEVTIGKRGSSEFLKHKPLRIVLSIYRSRLLNICYCKLESNKLKFYLHICGSLTIINTK